MSKRTSAVSLQVDGCWLTHWLERCKIGLRKGKALCGSGHRVEPSRLPSHRLTSPGHDRFIEHVHLVTDRRRTGAAAGRRKDCLTNLDTAAEVAQFVAHPKL